MQPQADPSGIGLCNHGAREPGLTLGKVVVSLDTKRILSNLTYVALSRVRHPQSPALENIAAPFDRFPKEGNLSFGQAAAERCQATVRSTPLLKH